LLKTLNHSYVQCSLMGNFQHIIEKAERRRRHA
jgi:hypothetical protein